MRLIITILALAGGVLFTGACVPEDPTPVQPAEQGGAGGGESKAQKAPIGLAAKRTTADPSPLSSGGALTCVKVTVTNRTKKQVEVNPLYFAITGRDGTKHDAATALGEYEGQIDTMQIAPGEKAKGTVCVTGKFAPKTVSMTNPLFSTAARAQVAS
jgi:hypothetical protein